MFRLFAAIALLFALISTRCFGPAHASFPNDKHRAAAIDDPCAADVVPPEWQVAESVGDLQAFIGDAATLASHLYPSVGNGYWGTTVLNDTSYIGGVYSGRGAGWSLESDNNHAQPTYPTPSHRARIPSTSAFVIRGATAGENDHNVSDMSFSVAVTAQAIDFRRAIFFRRITALDGRLCIEQRFYAHQVLRTLLVTEFEVLRADVAAVLHFELVNGSVSEDILFEDLDEPSLPSDARAQYGLINQTEEQDSARIGVALVSSAVPVAGVRVDADGSLGKIFPFLSVAVTTLENKDEHLADQNVAMAEASHKWLEYMHTSPQELRRQHEMAWAVLWESGISIEPADPRNVSVGIAINASLYYILSAVRSDWQYGISPGGIATNAYNGHVFWDMETWMLPTLLVLHPTVARSLLDYRFARLDAAKKKAQSYQAGYDGVMFPWESALTGAEVCPWKIGALYEQHITADVSFACMQYYYATADKSWMSSRGQAIVNASAEFWASRVESTAFGQFQILGVVPPDESAGVRNNSCYTNVAAATALVNAAWLGKQFGYSTPARWIRVASNMVVPFSRTLEIHPEYDGYDGALINQPDVVLLQYPLEWKSTKTVKLNDLFYYFKHTNMESFFTGYSTYGILFAEHGFSDRAQEVFDRAWAFMQKPFSVWREKITGGHQNFLTGAGVFLQQVAFGYAGIRLQSSNMSFNPHPPPRGVAAFVFRRLSYQGVDLQIKIGPDRVTVALADSHVQDVHDDATKEQQSIMVVQDGTLTRISYTAVELKFAPFALVSG